MYNPKTSSGRPEGHRLLHQLLRPVADLHSKGIVLGDLKTSNLFMCSDGRLRLGGFQLRATTSQATVTSAHCYRPRIARSNDTLATHDARRIDDRCLALSLLASCFAAVSSLPAPAMPTLPVVVRIWSLEGGARHPHSRFTVASAPNLRTKEALGCLTPSIGLRIGLHIASRAYCMEGTRDAEYIDL
ncbi:hypothetical protein B0H11DRAFT_2022525, partial [Mycena galericulata]